MSISAIKIEKCAWDPKCLDLDGFGAQVKSVLAMGLYPMFGRAVPKSDLPPNVRNAGDSASAISETCCHLSPFDRPSMC